MLNTMIGSGIASISWMLVDLLLTGRPSIVGIMNGCIPPLPHLTSPHPGAVAGLVTITPCAGFVSQTGAFVIGVVGGVGVSRGVLIKDILQFDDALDAFGVHAIGGLLGSLLVGLFAKEEIGGVNGAFYGHPKQFGLQLFAVVVSAGWACVGTFLVMTFVDLLVGLRVSVKKEGNMDRSQHGSTMYSQITEVPKNKKAAEEERKKMTLMRRLKGTSGNDEVLDASDGREMKERRIAKMITEEQKDHAAAGEEDEGFLEEVSLESNGHAGAVAVQAREAEETL
jgi:hypothetical protein